jgi:hypothetical protein
MRWNITSEPISVHSGDNVRRYKYQGRGCGVDNKVLVIAEEVVLQIPGATGIPNYIQQNTVISIRISVF